MKKLLCFFLATVFLSFGLLSCADEWASELPEVKNLVWASGTELPKASDFLTENPEGCSIFFDDDANLPSKEEIGSFDLVLTFQNARGKKAKKNVTLQLILDTEAPELVGVKDLSCVIGEGLSYLSGVYATDNCDGEVTVTVNSSNVNLTAEGHYSATYVATDAAGNKSEKTVGVSVYLEAVTEEMLYAEIDRVIGGQRFDTMPKTEICRIVYDYVYDHVSYVGTSDKSDWVRAAYYGLENGEGDCFTYFALSKAFFNRFGIESVDLCRNQTAVDASGQRHYWNMVNIGTSASPLWYHFDACHMADLPKYSNWGFLMTDAQLAAYTDHRIAANGATGYFYSHDSGCPTSATAEITVIPAAYLK